MAGIKALNLDNFIRRNTVFTFEHERESKSSLRKLGVVIYHFHSYRSRCTFDGIGSVAIIQFYFISCPNHPVQLFPSSQSGFYCRISKSPFNSSDYVRRTYLFQDNQTLKRARQRNVLLVFQLSTLTIR